MERERSVDSLRKLVEDLELKLNEVSAMLQESHAELLSEKDVNFWLRDLISKIEQQVVYQFFECFHRNDLLRCLHLSLFKFISVMSRLLSMII
jgi:hypothetical protein